MIEKRCHKGKQKKRKGQHQYQGNRCKGVNLAGTTPEGQGGCQRNKNNDQPNDIENQKLSVDSQNLALAQERENSSKQFSINVDDIEINQNSSIIYQKEKSLQSKNHELFSPITSTTNKAAYQS